MNASPMEDRSLGLLRQARRGDDAARAALLAKANHYLARIAASQSHGRLRAKADSSDLVQDTLLEAHRHFRQFRGLTPEEFDGWLRSIFKAVTANHFRRFLATRQRDARLELRIDREYAGSLGDLCPPAPAHDTPLALAIERETHEQLDRALRTLPPHYYQVIVLRYLEEQSCEEVAAQMRRSIDSVENIRSRALAQLRKTMNTA